MDSHRHELLDGAFVPSQSLFRLSEIDEFFDGLTIGGDFRCGKQLLIRFVGGGVGMRRTVEFEGNIFLLTFLPDESLQVLNFFFVFPRFSLHRLAVEGLRGGEGNTGNGEQEVDEEEEEEEKEEEKEENEE